MTYSLNELKLQKSRTDWAKVDAATEDDLARMDDEDPDLRGLGDIDWSKATIVTPEPKSAISIRLDAEVLAFFKAGGKGYQSRINAVLRSYVKAAGKL